MLFRSAIGALTRHHEVESSSLLKEQVPLLAHTAHQVGDPQVRHRGTLGGTLAHGDPASDLPAAVLALGGVIVAQGPNGRREIQATEFFEGFLETALAQIPPGETPKMHPVMRLSARNQRRARVTSETHGDVLSTFKTVLADGQRITAVITKESVSDLDIAPDDEVLVVIKSTEVMLAKP